MARTNANGTTQTRSTAATKTTVKPVVKPVKPSAEVVGNALVITLPYNDKGEISGTGKSLVVATTNGFWNSDAENSAGKQIRISVNAIISK